MNIKINKILIAVLVMTVALATVATGAASVAQVEAFLANDFNFRVDGEAWTPKDVDGSELTPIVYRDRTYVPVRALLEDQGVEVDWDNDTRTVILNYSALKPIDKASPLLMTAAFNDSDDDGDGLDDGTESFLIQGNPLYEGDENVAVNPMYEFTVNNETQIWVDGKQMESSIALLIRLNQQWKCEDVKVDVDSESGIAKQVVITSGEEGKISAALSEDEEDNEKPNKLKITYAPIFSF